jgi:phosphopantetheinyl transferase
MILLKIINTSEISENKVIYSDEIKKIKFKKDRKLAFASQYLKSLVTKKYYSISHSYPYCVICESDRKVGVDIENTNRNIDHQEIYEKKIGGNKKITKLEFLTE